jgi:predicted glycosyltransferase
MLVNFLSEYGRVIITTERDIDEEFLSYQMKVSPEKIHSLMAYAKILIGDSQTMCSEAAVLGVPSMRCNSFAGRVSYLEEQEKKYELVYSFLPSEFEKLFEKVKEWVEDPELKTKWMMRRQNMLKDKIDVTSFFKKMIYQFIEKGDVKKSDFDFNQFKG